MTEEQPDRPAEEAGSLAELTAQLDAARTAERAAVARLREALLASQPELEPGMVNGETLEQVEASFAAATTLLGRLREKATRESLQLVPPGAPGRTTARSRTAFEKIRDGLGRAG